jgi:ribose transport system substrate-binding protein
MTAVKRLATYVLVAALAVLAGCSSSSTGSSGSSSNNSAPAESATGASAAAGVSLQAEAATKVAEFEAGPASYPGPTTAFNPGTGKAGVMACGFVAAVCAEQANFAVQALTAMGWDAGTAFDGAFSPQVYGGFVDRAVQDDLNGIVLISIDVSTIKASIDRAIAAKLPIMCVMCTTGPDYLGKGVTDVTVDWKQQGVMAGWKVLSDNGDQAKVATFADAQFQSSVQRSEGLEATLKDNCPTCTFQMVPFAAADAAKPGPPQLTSLLASNPEGTITNVVGHYDGVGIPMAKTVVQTGRNEIKVGGYDGQADALAALVSQDPPYDFTVAEPYTYAGWAAADLLGRTKAGVPLWADANLLPSTLITAKNAQKFLDGNPPPSTQPAPSGDWQGQFKTFWGKG